MPLPRIILRPHKDKALQRGYPWVFANQVDTRRSDGAERGEVVQLESSSGETYGLALYHDRSLISARFLTSDISADIGPAFFRERLTRAIELRKHALPETTHARLVFGESDGMPGTVIDRYGPPGYSGGILTWSCLSYGMESYRDMILDVLEEVLQPDAIVERNDLTLRAKDDLEQSTGVLRGNYPGRVVIDESGVLFEIDVLNGPKTGFFIDQRANRIAARSLTRGRDVLDVFSADGGFGLHAAVAGARHVHMIDVSASALQRAMGNAARNNVADRVTTETTDALNRLGALVEEGARYDVIILDPPSFAASRKNKDAATRAYQRLNISALQLLKPGGILVTSSCSQALDEADFLQIIRYSAKRTDVRFRYLYRGSSPVDHPTLDSMPETEYLKCFIIQKLGDELP